MSVSAADIELALRAALAPLAIEVRDDSHLHAGHSGAQEGRHFSVRVVSTAFKGLTRLARHRLVYHSLNSLMPRGIHALAVDARVPDEAPNPIPGPGGDEARRRPSSTSPKGSIS
jgi:BolA protein